MVRYYRLSAWLESAIANHCDVCDAAAIKELARDVKQISDKYIEARNNTLRPDIFASERTLRAYLCYYVPVNLVKIFPVLEELDDGQQSLLVRPTLSVLDLGAGPGTFTLGLLDHLMQRCTDAGGPPSVLRLWCLDESRNALHAAQDLITRYGAHCADAGGPHVEVRCLQGSICTDRPNALSLPADSRFDLIIVGNVMNETQHQNAALLAALLERHVAPQGACILIDPGTRPAARRLVALRDLVLTNTSLTLFAPCLCAGRCPLSDQPRQWCHEKISWDPPALVRKIDAHTGFSKSKGLKFAYFTFLKAPLPGVPPAANGGTGPLWRVSSYIIKSKGEQRLYICNGVQRLLLRRLNRHATVQNAAFSQAQRGDRVVFSGQHRDGQRVEIDRDSSFQIVRRLREAEHARRADD